MHEGNINFILQSLTHSVFSVCLLMCFMGCEFPMGPPMPEYHTEKYLREHGFGTNIIAAVLDGKEMDRGMVAVLIRIPDISVRHMLGRNRFLTRDERGMLFQDQDEYVRSGVAMNPGLTREEVLNAMTDQNRRRLVGFGLAMNATVPQDILMQLRNQYGVALIAFAQNSNCPPVIVREIEQSGDSLAKKILGITRRLYGGPPDWKETISTNDKSVR